MEKSEYFPLASSDGDADLPEKRYWGTLARYLLISLGAVLYMYPFVYTFRDVYQEHTPSKYGMPSLVLHSYRANRNNSEDQSIESSMEANMVEHKVQPS